MKIFLLLVISSILFLSLLGLRGLCEPDEGRYVEIAREMIESKDFLEPRLNYIKHFHKPPLVYWLVAASFSIFGMNEFAARLPVALFAICGVIVTFFIATCLGKDRKTAFTSSMILLTSVQYFTWSQVLSADMIFCFFIYLAILGFWLRYKNRTVGTYIFFLGLACAFMVKGPVAVIIPFSIILAYIILGGERSFGKPVEIFFGIILFLLLVSPWFIYVCNKNPSLFTFFVRNQSFDRFFTTHHGRGGNILYFIPVLFAGFLPWIFFLPQAIKKYKPWRKDKKIELFLFLWLAIPFLFFSLSRSKLPGYILPIYPAISILVGSYICDKNYYKAFKIISVSGIIIYMAALLFIPGIEEKLNNNLSIRKIAKYVRAHTQANEKVINFRCFLQSLPFYLGRRVVLVEKERDMQFEKNPDIHKNYIFLKIDDFWKSIKENEKFWCFTKERDYSDLTRNSPFVLYKIWQSSGYVLATNHEK